MTAPVRREIPPSFPLAIALAAIVGGTLLSPSLVTAQELSQAWRDYFDHRVTEIELRNRTTAITPQEWPERVEHWREELRDMLGLVPSPPREDLHATVTGTCERNGVIVENLHFQSIPGLYVTANLYRPVEAAAPLPAVLYLCGHGGVKKEGVSFGNKVHYHHHGVWLAEHGYVCLILDSLQLGEIEAIHHGTYRYDRWWWINRGYTPAGVEAWNCVRALDYLETRGDVDMSRVGCSGRSGGGAYSWWIAAIDPRISTAIPVAGITDLRNYVVDDCVEGHCDCMFFVNRFGWDYPRVAQLVAPRPLLIANSDRDSIFPLDGVQRTYWQTRSVYERLGQPEHLALAITPGGHADTQEIRVPAFRWLNHHLQKNDDLLTSPAKPRFEAEELKVFRELPGDEINTVIDEQFVPGPPSPAPPADPDRWPQQCDQWLQDLRSFTFRSWPEDSELQEATLLRSVAEGPVPFAHYRLSTQAPLAIDIHVLNATALPGHGDLNVRILTDEEHHRLVQQLQRAEVTGKPSLDWLGDDLDGNAVIVTISPRGVGQLAGPADVRANVQWRRRLYLIGETVASGQAWDIRQALKWLRGHTTKAETTISVHGGGALGVAACYATLFEPAVDRFVLTAPPVSHRSGPYLIDVRRVWDIPDLLAVVSSMTRLEIRHSSPALAESLQAYEPILGDSFPQFTESD